MITPFFKLDQDDNFLTITIRVKYIRISEIDFFIENNNFRFSLKPYYLNLYFSNNIIDSERNSSKYDVEKGILTILLEKETPGMNFDNLDLLSNLMVETKKNTINKSSNINKIEELKNNENSINENIQYNEINEKKINFEIPKKNFLNKNFSDQELNDLYFELLSTNQNKKILNSLKILIGKEIYTYGFNNQYFDVFNNRQEELIEISDLNPEKVTCFHRYFEKMRIENNDFIPERYIGDLNLQMENPEIFELDLQKFFEKQIQNNLLNSLFTEKEHTTLVNLNKIKLNLLNEEIEEENFEDLNLNSLELNILFTKELNFEFYLQTIDILFAFLFDYRVNDFEANSESGWNISKLSSTLSCFVDYRNLFYSFTEDPPFNLIEELIKNLLISVYRRVLCYPLYRSIELCEKIRFSDLMFVIGNGKNYILKCLLNVRIAFERSEPRFILNQILIDQLIRWVQVSNDSIWKVLGDKVKSMEIVVGKDDMKMNLAEVEEEYI